MPDKAPSPFATLGGLDKALLRSTHQQPSTPERPLDQPSSAEMSRANPPATTPVSDQRPLASEQAVLQENKPPSRQSSKIASNKSNRAINNSDNQDASLLASKLAQPRADVVQLIRKAIKTPGKEVSFVRLTAEEKGQLADIVYTYKRQGKKTSENEINRIAINYILEDYRTNGELSILAKVIEALLA